MARLPNKVRDAVRAELGRHFDAMRWEELSPAQATAAYTQLARDPKVGGLMAPFMSSGEIRVWIKDGPAKEYRRGLEGTGYMAEYTSRAYPGRDALVASALGTGWSVDPESVQQKPMRCVVTNAAGESMSVLWGALSQAQGLHWTASTLRIREPQRPVTVIYTRPSGVPLEGEDWELARSLASLIDASCTQVTYAVAKKPEAAGKHQPRELH